MSYYLILVAGLVGSSAAAAINLTAGPEEHALVRRDRLTPLTGCSTYADKKWQPMLDFDTDSCYNVAAISRTGQLNPGQPCSASSIISGCRDREDLTTQNVYSRSRCNSGWCAHMYAYYFEKDWADIWCTTGHLHDWEHVVIWTRNDKIEYVAVSQHGNYEKRAAKDVIIDGTHPKIVYHRQGGLTHAFRFANDGEKNSPENDLNKWVMGSLVSYYGFPNHDIRNKLMDADFGSAKLDIRNSVFAANLAKARPGAASAFITGQDGPEDIHNSPGLPANGCGVKS